MYKCIVAWDHSFASLCCIASNHIVLSESSQLITPLCLKSELYFVSFSPHFLGDQTQEFFCICELPKIPYAAFKVAMFFYCLYKSDTVVYKDQITEIYLSINELTHPSAPAVAHLCHKCDIPNSHIPSSKQSQAT